MDSDTSTVICCNCTINEILSIFEIEIEQLSDYPKINVVGYGGDKAYFCKECEDELQPLEMYFEDEDDLDVAKELISEKIAAILTSKIENCSHCAGQDIEDYQYRAQKEDIYVRDRGIDLCKR